MIKMYRKTIRGERLYEIKKPLPGTWILVSDPKEEEIKLLTEEFKISAQQILDGLDPFEVPHLDILENMLYIFLRFPVRTDEIKMLPILFIITPDYLFSITKDFMGVFDQFLRGEVEFYTTQKTRLFLLLSLKINNDFKTFVNTIGKEIEKYQERIGRVSPSDIFEIGKKEITVSSILLTLIAMNKVYENLLAKEYLDFLREEKGIVDDLSLTVRETIEISRSLLKRIQMLKDMASTLFEVKTTKALYLLTTITVLFSIPILIFSFYGMNVALPFQTHKLAFVFVIGFSLLVMLVSFLIFKIKKWL